MAKDFFSNGFDKGTKKKIEIFDKYFNEAFPVFVHSKGMEEIYICDFFAGQGMDKHGNFGTSLNIVDSISNHCKSIVEKNKKVILVLNDKEEYDSLQNNIKDFLKDCKTNCTVNDDCIFEIDKNLHIKDNDFSSYFYHVYNILEKKSSSPKIIFIDPFGLVISDDIFQKLIDLPRTDFICFIPTSFLKRFQDFKRFNEYINLKNINFKKALPNQCHQVIAEYFESQIPPDRNYFLSHFSIQKGSNIYGLIFGTNHTLGAEKFLNICWKIDKISGEADYNIHREACYSGDTLFDEMNTPQKIKNLGIDIKEQIFQKKLNTNKDAYIYGLKRRCLPKHVSEIIKDMIKNGNIEKIPTKNSDIHKLEVQQFKVVDKK